MYKRQLVTRTLLAHGAPRDIAYKQKPHIGTDALRDVIVSIRREVEALGGKVLFNTPLTGLRVRDGRLAAVCTPQGELPCGALLLAPGHSARDTFEMCIRDRLYAILLPQKSARKGGARVEVDILLPAPVRSILSTLQQQGHSAFAVGGCVRDSLMGRAPHDWDVCRCV